MSGCNREETSYSLNNVTLMTYVSPYALSVNGLTKNSSFTSTSGRHTPLQEPKRKHNNMCTCVHNVDLDIFRGAFTEQWLRGAKFGAREPLFFCSTCGPPVVQDHVKETKPGHHKSEEKKHKGSRKSNGSSVMRTLSSWFAKKDKGSSSAAMTAASNQEPSSAAHESLSKETTRLFNATDEEELPVTPRTEKELFLCATCGACYCRDHAWDHNYSRGGGGAGGAEGGDAVRATHTHAPSGYPNHSFFIGVPSYISTHPAHAMRETEWGLLLPTVLVKEVEEGSVDLSSPLQFYEDFVSLADEYAPASATSFSAGLTHSAPMTRPPSARSNMAALTESATELASTLPPMHPSPLPFGQGLHSAQTSKDTTRDTSVPNGAAATSSANSGLSPPVYYANPPENWSYMLWCARCAVRPICLNGQSYDPDTPSHRDLRRLGQLLALLAYFRFRGVRLALSSTYNNYIQRQHLTLNQQQQQRRQQLSGSELQCVMKSTETTSSGLTGRDTSRLEDGANAGRPLMLRADVDRLLARRSICGFSNSNYFCYINSVLQCILRCMFFSQPLLHLNLAASPGKLTTSMCHLLRHLREQTYQDVLNHAADPFVYAVYKQVCGDGGLFEVDQQQDAHELLIMLLNGIADEFDKGKSEEEKRSMKRLSFEGVLRTKVMCCACHSEVRRDEMFMSISVPVQGSLQEGLDKMFKDTYLTGKDRYACESCFNRMSSAEQTAHNDAARLQEEEQKRLKAAQAAATEKRGKGVNLSLNISASATASLPKQGSSSNMLGAGHVVPAAPRLHANCVYQDAIVHTEIARLGETLAVHILRFQYSPELQNFIKITTPVRVPFEIDLTPYVSKDMLKEYNEMLDYYTLLKRFSRVDEATCKHYYRKAGNKYRPASLRMIKDGYTPSHSRQCSSTEVVAPPAPSQQQQPPGGLAGGNRSSVATRSTSDGRRVTADETTSAASTTTTTECSLRAVVPTPLNHSTSGNGTTVIVQVPSPSSSHQRLRAATTPRANVEDGILDDDVDPYNRKALQTPALVRHLVGIVIHRGSLDSGHYIAFVRYLAWPDMWFRCDDEDIDIVDQKTVEEAATETYLAFYE